MPYDSFPKVYLMDSLKGYIGRYIEQYKPSVLFTLDDVIGGYGHPDHVLVSKLARKYCEEHKSDSGFSVKKIYQNVFSPSLSENVMKNSPTYIQAKQVYHCDGMPEPSVQINFYDYARNKKMVIQAYTTEQNSLRKIWPYYHWYPAFIYFKIFDRDFFHVVDII